MRKSRLEWAVRRRLIEHFVSGSTARTAASLVGEEHGSDVLLSSTRDHSPADSSLSLSEGTCSASEIYEPHAFLGLGQVVEKEIKIEREYQSPWRLDTEVLSNGYKLFQLLIRPVAKKQNDANWMLALSEGTYGLRLTESFIVRN